MEPQQAVKLLLEQGELPTQDRINRLTSPEPLVQVEKAKSKVNSDGTSLEIVQHFEYTPRKFTVPDFTTYFRNRYTYLKNLLLNRPETENATSISKLAGLHEKVTIVATIIDMKMLPTGTMKLTLEDLSGSITAFMSAKNPELVQTMQHLTFDEVLAFKGSSGKNVFFVDDVIWPDIPQKTMPTCSDDVYVAFTGDIHSGSNMFMPAEFGKFVSWLRGEYGSPAQREVAQKTKYVFFLGDTVDGVGIYPEQQKELQISDIYKQYELVAKYLEQIPSDKHLILIPGNHDAMRLCEPQPVLYRDYAEPIYKLPNVTCVSNPAVVKVHAGDDFPGINILLYHGYSFDYFVDSVEALRLAGGYDVPDKIWEFLLKRRHLAPTYGATLALPLADDPLLIRQVPDVVASGHIHKAKIGAYKGVTSISGSCWQSKTVFQERVGHHPDPAFVPLLSLKTGKTNMLQFK
jgi:DNA polymerase II small subunit